MEISDLQAGIKNPLAPEDFAFIKNECEEMIRIGSPEECKDLANYIGTVLQDYSGQLQANPQMFDTYQAYWHRLAFRGFINLPANIKSDLLQRRVLFAVSKGFDPDYFIFKYFDVIGDSAQVRNIFAGFVKLLEQNTETLGGASLTIEDKKYLPQLKNWILDYAKYPSLNARRGSIDRLNYINQSPNVRALTQGQRQVLLRVLKFYDDLLNPEQPALVQDQEDPVYDVVPRPKQNAEVPGQFAVPVPKPPAEVFGADPGKIDIDRKLEDLKNRSK